MTDVCPCHGEPWAPSGKNRRCRVKKRARDRERFASMTPEQLEHERARKRKFQRKYRSNKTPEQLEHERKLQRKRRATPEQRDRHRGHNRKYAAKKREARDAFDRKLGKLLNLSINPAATESERALAREKYHRLKEGRQVA